MDKHHAAKIQEIENDLKKSPSPVKLLKTTEIINIATAKLIRNQQDQIRHRLRLF